jgi:hypothetical protein
MFSFSLNISISSVRRSLRKEKGSHIQLRVLSFTWGLYSLYKKLAREFGRCGEDGGPVLVSLVVFRVRALIGTDTPISHHHIISNTYEVGLGRRRIPHVLVDLRRKCKAVAMQHIIESLHRIILKVATLKLFSKKPEVDVQQISSRLDLTNNVLRSGLVVFRRLAFAIFVVLMSRIQPRYKVERASCQRGRE